MSKWIKVDPAEIKVGDLVKVRHVSDAYEATTSAVATNVTDLQIGVGPYNLYKNEGTWYIAKPKKAKPDSELADGHSAHHWRNRYNKQLDHNKQLEASNAGRRVKMQRLEKEAKDARRSVMEWESRYAVLAASINELPKKPTPPTRPDEPPVGLIFRVDRTGELYLRMHEGNGDYGYVSLLGDREGDLCTWTDITDHGDTITRLLLAEATDD
jgi:hypothetical protein